MRNSSNSAGLILASLLGLIILGVFIYKLKTKRRVVYMNAEIVNNTGEVTHV